MAEALGRTDVRRYDPVLALWRLLTSVRFAAALIAFLAMAGLLGVLLPQMPAAMQTNPAATEAWLEFQRGKFGPAAEPLYRLGLFTVFASVWFKVGLAALVASVGVCVGSRFPPIWRAAVHPPRRVPLAYFEAAHHRASFATPADPEALARALRRHRYKVARFQEAGAAYLFADRLPWATLGTFATHLSLILFITGGLVSSLTGFRSFLFTAEGMSAPVFPQAQHPRQMQVYVEDAVGRFDARGRPLEYRTEMVIYQGGQEVKRGVVTVNGPLSYGGYRFHQAAYYGYGAALQVRDLSTGNVIYKEVLSLQDTVPGPHLVVSKGGQAILDRTLVPTDLIASAYGTTVPLPFLPDPPGPGLPRSGMALPDSPDTIRRFWVGAKPSGDSQGWQMVVFEVGEASQPVRLVLDKGERAEASGLEFQFADLAPLPAAFVRDIPLPPGMTQQGPALLTMGNAVYGSGEASAGRAVAVPRAEGPPTLHIAGLMPQAMSLAPGESAVAAGYEYTFLGQREFAGIEVRRDRGPTLIWVAAALLLLGLGATFYLPRRRLWARITPDRTYLAGTAPHMVNFAQEMKRLGAEADSPDAQQDEEE